MSQHGLGVGVAVTVLSLLASGPWWLAGRQAEQRVHAAAHRPVAAGRGGPAQATNVDTTVLLELAAAALRAGAGIPRALHATGQAVGGPEGGALVRVSDALRLGADWDTAWRAAPRRLDPVRRGLQSAWADGAAPGESLRAAAEELVHARRAAARAAAARLSVRLVLPLGACFLPAFVLVGLVPVLLALGVGLLAG